MSSRRGIDKRTVENLERFNNLHNKILLNEQLKFIVYDGVIQKHIISSKGVLYTIIDNEPLLKIRKPYMDNDGHLRISINVVNSKGESIATKFFIHRLVGLAFIPNPENKPQIHHKDGDEINNDYRNLIWVTDKEHHELTKELEQYHGVIGSRNSSAKYTDYQISKVIELLEKNELYLDEISDTTGVSINAIQHLRERPNAWAYLKEGHDISGYNKFRRKSYTNADFEKFVALSLAHPEYSREIISKALNIPIYTVKTWRRRAKDLKLLPKRNKDLTKEFIVCIDKEALYD